jgi:hypothetical protein
MGSNSCLITIPSSAALADLTDTVEAWLSAHGWGVYDASAGTNARAYRAVCLDTVRYKYVVLDYNTAGKIILKVYESWNSSTHAGTNLGYNSDSASYCQQIDLTAGSLLYLFAHARWLAIESNLAGAIGSATGGQFTGCFEVTCDNPEDTPVAGYPCWVWVCFGITSGGSISFCRLRNGNTGSFAASPVSFISNGIFGGVYAGGQVIPNLTIYISTSNDWNGLPFAFNFIVGACGTAPMISEIRGRLFGLSSLSRNGAFMDSVTLLKDSNYILSASGALVNHWVIGKFGSSDLRCAIPK